MSFEYPSKILIVDDDQDILQMLRLTFLKENFPNITTCNNAEEVLQLIQDKRFDLILLDVMLPGKSGFDVLSSIRKKTECPVFFLTAKGSDLDKLTGFAYGADDYITKPFNPLEVVARAKATLKRINQSQSVHTSNEKDIFDFGYFQVNSKAAELVVNGSPIECSAYLFRLLIYFCENEGQVLSKDQIYEHVWGRHGDFVENNTIIVHIRKLREKIEPTPSKPKFIKTIRGLGYKLVRDR
ncbi:DNA-binding response regulator, OmpR family, contains REC and winged-helix (wHTH) domain [Halobacillus karajensis]|uniref:response regulator transcription factor n=1 Tax=Halobacillus karajensis TaxID=195088 RepID=UPI0008A753B3|nr:response regulator transcription factor [Halobacillus karajensis]SEH51080.1 DNA-binding response regulator, OmpR family, contains REC and winged-helix (wHTH) domain [Halobacillus karajensis]